MHSACTEKVKVKNAPNLNHEFTFPDFMINNKSVFFKTVITKNLKMLLLSFLTFVVLMPSSNARLRSKVMYF